MQKKFRQVQCRPSWEEEIRIKEKGSRVEEEKTKIIAIEKIKIIAIEKNNNSRNWESLKACWAEIIEILEKGIIGR